MLKIQLKPSLLAVGIALLSLPMSQGTKPANASANYQERDGIFGEIKYVEFCNMPAGLRFRAVAEAGSRDSRVYSVEWKVFTRYAIEFNAFGNVWGYTTGANWRHEGTDYNTLWGDRRWYEEFYPIVPLTTTAGDTPFKVAIHVNHSRGKTIDLGGIIDLGAVPVGKCRAYDDGNFRDW